MSKQLRNPYILGNLEFWQVKSQSLSLYCLCDRNTCTPQRESTLKGESCPSSQRGVGWGGWGGRAGGEQLQRKIFSPGN